MSACTEDYWWALESLLGRDRCVGFMFMGRLSNGINQYKHGISRRYLFLDDDGAAYERVYDGGFRRIAMSEAMARIEEPLREIGETLETPYVPNTSDAKMLLSAPRVSRCFVLRSTLASDHTPIELADRVRDAVN